MTENRLLKKRMLANKCHQRLLGYLCTIQKAVRSNRTSSIVYISSMRPLDVKSEKHKVPHVREEMSWRGSLGQQLR